MGRLRARFPLTTCILRTGRSRRRPSAGRERADELIGSCPRLRVLATSRHPLDVPAEAVFAVPPLGSPDPTAGPNALRYDAVRLLLDRAHAAVPQLTLDEADAPRAVPPAGRPASRDRARRRPPAHVHPRR